MLALTVPASISGAAGPPPAGFFGIAPQTPLTQLDTRYMAAGGIETVRLPVSWASMQPTAGGPYQWSGLDEAVAAAARAGLRVFPVVYGTPRWLAPKPTMLPVDSGEQREAWSAFLTALVKRYGPEGEFWAERAPGVAEDVPAVPNPVPIREWQIWNEANFFYFATPISPRLYAQLLRLSHDAIKSVDPLAKIVLSGLFGEPTAKAPRGMPAAKFLDALYRVPEIKSDFDGIALHPYAVDTEALEELVEAFHAVTVENHDRVGLYITEMGWGSQDDFNRVAFEQGVGGQVRELRGAYRYLLANRSRLDLKQVDWFSWKDLPGSCNFCNSVGLFRAGPGLKPKAAWRAFVALTGGQPRP